MPKKKTETKKDLPAKLGEQMPEKFTNMDAFAIFDALDEIQIVEEIKGKVLRDWVYQFQQEGRTVQGVAKAGIDAACQYLAGQGKIIRDENVEMLTLPDGEVGFMARCAVYSIDRETGQEYKQNEAIGTKNQPMYFSGGKKNPHWFTAGSQKAIRNARRRLIPEAVINHILAEALKDGRVRTIGPGDQKQLSGGGGNVSPPKPTTGSGSSSTSPPPESKDKVKTEIQSMILQIAEGDPERVLPIFQDITKFNKFDEVPESEYNPLRVKVQTALDRWKSTGNYKDESDK